MKKLPYIVCFFLLFNACTTFNHKNPYPNMEVIQYENFKVYEFKNLSSDRLIINIEGSGWTSVLGSQGKKKWNWVGVGSQIIQVLGNKYTILIPEKWDWNPETNYWWNFNARVNYTFDNLLECYLTSITKYLNEHNYSSIVLIGISEGALLLPIIYDHIKEKHNVTGMVSWGFGGFSLYESYSMLKNAPIVPEDQKQMYKFFCDMFETKNMDAYSTEKYGLSLMDIRPFDYYAKIDIPILFLHGNLDINVPVDSTMYIQENLKEKPFDYWYFYEMAHGPSNYIQTISVRKKIAEWINKNNL
jgi:esterase/lipase